MDVIHFSVQYNHNSGIVFVQNYYSWDDDTFTEMNVYMDIL